LEQVLTCVVDSMVCGATYSLTVPRAIHLGRSIAERAIGGGPCPARANVTAVPMTTDHQITEHQPTDTESGLGMIVTALIVLATLATVVLLVTR
jgi:hypothetical protein